MYWYKRVQFSEGSVYFKLSFTTQVSFPAQPSSAYFCCSVSPAWTLLLRELAVSLGAVSPGAEFAAPGRHAGLARIVTRGHPLTGWFRPATKHREFTHKCIMIKLTRYHNMLLLIKRCSSTQWHPLSSPGGDWITVAKICATVIIVLRKWKKICDIWKNKSKSDIGIFRHLIFTFKSPKQTLN